MAGGMPYQLEKGPYFSVTESVLEDQAMRVDLLARLRRGEPFDEMPSLDASTLNAGPLSDFLSRIKHQNEDWYGKKLVDPVTRRPVPAGTPGAVWQAQGPFDKTIDPATGRMRNPVTGYWYSWYGDAEAIMRRTFTRAIEVALGVVHDETANTVSAINPARNWPIEVFWRCPAPWFEGWVTWQRDPSSTGSGHVTVHLLTPSHHRSALLLSPIRSAPASGVPEYGQDPQTPPTPPAPPLVAAPYGDRGMWVIAHRDQREHLVYGPTGGTSGAWDLPSFGPLVESKGDIVVVQPNEPDGGVRSGGRAYV